MPVMKPRGRREQVMATKFEVPDGWTPPVYEKTETAQAFLKDVMESNKLMKLLSPSDREQLQQAFQEKTFPDGTQIIKQGDPGNDFYILEDGEADISIEGKGTVMTATRGVAFGELALLHNAPRAATVTCKGSVKTWALDMITFKAILMGKSQSDTTKYVEFLKGIPLLAHLGETELKELCTCLKEVEYPQDYNIICEGDEGDNFYIIREGVVKCTKVGKGEVSKPLTAGNFFGELALLSSDKRAATVTVTTAKVTVLYMTRNEFSRLLGPLSAQIAQEAAGFRS